MDNKYRVVSIKNFLDDPNIDEGEIKNELASFSCSKNLDVERFFKDSAIEFAKKNQSITYLVYTHDLSNVLGYFTLAIKPISVKADTFGSTLNRKIARVSEFNTETNTYNLAAFLIAQIGKNYFDGLNDKITGNDLLSLALDIIKEIQDRAGGMVYFLEAENEEKLISFYENNGFKKFDTRESHSRSEEPHELIQLLKII